MTTAPRDKISFLPFYLRLPHRRDIARITELVQDRAVARFTLMPHPYDESDARAFVAAARKAGKKGTSFHFVIADSASDQVLGGIGLMGISRKHHTAEVGYWLGRANRGKGIMRVALATMCRFAFTDQKLERLYAHTDVDNVRSQKLLEASGFVQEGVLRKHVFRFGRRRDLKLYALLRPDWRKRNRPADPVKIIY